MCPTSSEKEETPLTPGSADQLASIETDKFPLMEKSKLESKEDLDKSHMSTYLADMLTGATEDSDKNALSVCEGEISTEATAQESSCESDSDDDMKIGPIRGFRPLVIPLSPSPTRSPITTSDSDSQSESDVTTDEDEIDIPSKKPKVKYNKPARSHSSKLHTIPELSEDEEEEVMPVRPPRPRRLSLGKRHLSDKSAESPGTPSSARKIGSPSSPHTPKFSPDFSSFGNVEEEHSSLDEDNTSSGDEETGIAEADSSPLEEPEETENQPAYVITPLGEESILTDHAFVPPMEMLHIPKLQVAPLTFEDVDLPLTPRFPSVPCTEQQNEIIGSVFDGIDENLSKDIDDIQNANEMTGEGSDKENNVMNPSGKSADMTLTEDQLIFFQGGGLQQVARSFAVTNSPKKELVQGLAKQSELESTDNFFPSSSEIFAVTATSDPFSSSENEIGSLSWATDPFDEDQNLIGLDFCNLADRKPSEGSHTRMHDATLLSQRDRRKPGSPAKVLVVSQNPSEEFVQDSEFPLNDRNQRCQSDMAEKQLDGDLNFDILSDEAEPMFDLSDAAKSEEEENPNKQSHHQTSEDSEELEEFLSLTNVQNECTCETEPRVDGIPLSEATKEDNLIVSSETGGANALEIPELPPVTGADSLYKYGERDDLIGCEPDRHGKDAEAQSEVSCDGTPDSCGAGELALECQNQTDIPNVSLEKRDDGTQEEQIDNDSQCVIEESKNDDNDHSTSSNRTSVVLDEFQQMLEKEGSECSSFADLSAEEEVGDSGFSPSAFEQDQFTGTGISNTVQKQGEEESISSQSHRSFLEEIHGFRTYSRDSESSNDERPPKADARFEGSKVKVDSQPTTELVTLRKQFWDSVAAGGTGHVDSKVSSSSDSTDIVSQADDVSKCETITGEQEEEITRGPTPEADDVFQDAVDETPVGLVGRLKAVWSSFFMGDKQALTTEDNKEMGLDDERLRDVADDTTPFDETADKLMQLSSESSSDTEEELPTGDAFMPRKSMRKIKRGTVQMGKQIWEMKYTNPEPAGDTTKNVEPENSMLNTPESLERESSEKYAYRTPSLRKIERGIVKTRKDQWEGKLVELDEDNLETNEEQDFEDTEENALMHNDDIRFPEESPKLHQRGSKTKQPKGYKLSVKIRERTVVDAKHMWEEKEARMKKEAEATRAHLYDLENDRNIVGDELLPSGLPDEGAKTEGNDDERNEFENTNTACCQEPIEELGIEEGLVHNKKQVWQNLCESEKKIETKALTVKLKSQKGEWQFNEKEDAKGAQSGNIPKPNQATNVEVAKSKSSMELRTQAATDVKAEGDKDDMIDRQPNYGETEERSVVSGKDFWEGMRPEQRQSQNLADSKASETSPTDKINQAVTATTETVNKETNNDDTSEIKAKGHVKAKTEMWDVKWKELEEKRRNEAIGQREESRRTENKLPTKAAAPLETVKGEVTCEVNAANMEDTSSQKPVTGYQLSFRLKEGSVAKAKLMHRLQYSPSKPKSSPVKRQTKRHSSPRKSPTPKASPVISYTARYLDTPKSPTQTRKERDDERSPPPSPPVDRPLTPEETEEFLQDIRGRVASQRKRFDSLGSVISESSGNSLDAVDDHTNHTAKSPLDLDEDYISCIVGKVSKHKKLWETKAEEKSQRNKDSKVTTKAQASRNQGRGKPQSPIPTSKKGRGRVTYIIHSTIEGDVVLETVDGTYSSHQESWDIQTRKQQQSQRLQAPGESMKVERKGADISEISRAHPRGDVDELVAAASIPHTTSDAGDVILPDEETRGHSPVIMNPSPHSSSWPSPQSCSPTQSAGEQPIEASGASEDPVASETAQYYQSYKHTFASARSFFESATTDQDGVELNNYTKYEDRHKSLADFVVTEQVNVSCNDSETWNYSSQGLNSPSNPIENAATDTDLEVDADNMKSVYSSQDMNYTRHSRKETQECETRLVDSGCQTDDEFEDTPRSRIYRVSRACQSDAESDNETLKVRDHSPSQDREIQVSEDDLTNPLKRRLPHDYRQYDLLENPKSKRRIYQRRNKSQTLTRSKSLPGIEFATIPDPKHNRTTINPLSNFWPSEPEADRPRSYKFGISDSSSLVASLMDLTRDLPTAYPDSHNQDDLEDLDHDVFQHFPQGEVIQTLSGCYRGEFPHIPVNGRTRHHGRVPRAGQRDLISLRELRRRASLPECLALLPISEAPSPEAGSPVEVIRNPFHPMDQITAQLMKESSVDNCENGTPCMYNSSESINLSVNSDESEKHKPVCDGVSENEQIADSGKEEWDTYGETTTDSNCDVEYGINESRNCVEATPNLTCSAYGDGLERGKLGEVLTFIVDTAGAQQGEVTISVDGPFKGSVSGTEVYPIEEYTGAYLVNYMVNTPAPYQVAITWSGQHIAGSPFTCIVEA
ncbi:hypothetical protein C7M84_010743 [Penaeus vannamei]|uniref:Uncharacterized protein n=1 Tax=Penaeus vannamei TaxID=6689 RepID=A0A3R7QL80_PENVA|nr:hypothetical protein C7M84_010743 [Penaeus vannamei]